MTTKRKKEKPFINPLLQGHESQERFDIILGLTSIRSKPMIKALKEHYVDGKCEELIVVDAGNYNRAKTTLGKVAAEIEKIKDIDWGENGKR